MRICMTRRALSLLLLLAVVVTAGGCTGRNGLDAAAKKSWDTARSGDTEDSLRHRLAYTQRDN